MADSQQLTTDPENPGRRCVDGECVMIDGKCETIATAADDAAEPAASLERQVFAEFLGTAFLVCTIIGSGMMGDNLSPDDGVALLGNTLAQRGGVDTAWLQHGHLPRVARVEHLVEHVLRKLR